MVRKVLLLILALTLLSQKRFIYAFSGFGKLMVTPQHFADIIPTSIPTLQPTPIPSQNSYLKKSYKIAVYGDSMVDTMGEKLDYLQKALRQNNPNISFQLYNYGIGAQNVATGLARFNENFSYKTRNFLSLSSLHPDIIILGSFSYNLFSPHDVGRHRLILSELSNKARATGAQVYLLAEIAPLTDNFSRGSGGVNWPGDQAQEQAKNITEQLEDTISLAKDLNLPLINVYQKSVGHKNYTSTYDGIHPSIAGHILAADLIAKKIELK